MVLGSGTAGDAKRKRGLALCGCESVPPAGRCWSPAGSLTDTAAVVVARMPGNLDLRRVGARPATVHSCAKAGDVEGLLMKLRENPALLNAPNDVVLRLFLLDFRFSMAERLFFSLSLAILFCTDCLEIWC